MTLRLAISGSACTGKTTLAAALARCWGLPLIPEAMRALLESGHPRLDRVPRLQAQAVLEGFVADLEGAERRHGAFVADNGALDLEAYGAWYGCELSLGAWERRYDAVILLPAGVLPYEADGLRQEAAEDEARFQALLEARAARSRLGPRLLRLPRELASLDARVAWVGDRCGRV